MFSAGCEYPRGRRPPEDDAMAFPDMPREIGSYRVTDYLGEGSLGHTVLVEHGEAGYRAVARLLPIEHSYECVPASQPFMEVATVVSALSHIGLADVLEVASLGTFVCVIEEAVPGVSVAQRLREGGALDPAEARQVIAQVFLAVDFAHQRHFPHGLVKPSNVFLMDRCLSVKVVDAGLPELLRQVAPERYARLTASPYAAPELWGGRPASVASDIYSIAVTYYEMLTGALPEGLTQFREASDAGRFDLLELGTAPSNAPDQARVDGVWPYLQSVANLPEQQARVLQQAMEREPGLRPATIRSMRVAFGFARPASPETRRAASGLLAGLAAETVGRMEYSTPARGGGDTCPACRRPLRPGASSCLACGYVMPPEDAALFQPIEEPSPAQTTARVEGIELADEPQRPAPAAAPEAQGRRAPSRLPLHADPLAEVEATTAIHTGDKRVDFFVTQGDRNLAAGRHDDALQSYRSAAGDTPASALAHNRAGDVLAMLRRYREAQRHYERAIALNPGDYDARHDLGRVLLTRGDLHGAAGHLRAVVEADPSPELRLSALTHLGSACCAQGDLEQAIEAWSRVVREGPPNAPVRYSLGVALARLGRQEEAKTQWRAALTDDPNHAESRAALTQAESAYGSDFMRVQRMPDGPGRGASLLTGALDILGSLLGPRRIY